MRVRCGRAARLATSRSPAIEYWLFINPASTLAVSANSGMIDSMHDKTANLRPAANGPPWVAILVPDGVTLFELGVASDIFSTDDTTHTPGPLSPRQIAASPP